MTHPQLRRSQLATPASSPNMMAGAADAAADEVIIDLEDSVAPAEKADARASLINAATTHDWTDTLLSYRINAIETPWWYDDLISVISEAGSAIGDIVVPKVQQPSDVHTIDNLLTQIEANASLPVGDIGLQVQIEDGTGVHNVHDIAHASPRLVSIIFGPGDYAAAIGAPGLDIGQFPEYPGHYWHYVLNHLNTAAKSAGILCIDGPYADFEDPEGFRTAGERARLIGCDGKWVIHPAQIELANEIFSPDPDVAKRAARIVSAYEEAMESGDGAVSVDGHMVDEATNKMAKEIVAKAKAANVL